MATTTTRAFLSIKVQKATRRHGASAEAINVPRRKESDSPAFIDKNVQLNIDVKSSPALAACCKPELLSLRRLNSG